MALVDDGAPGMPSFMPKAGTIRAPSTTSPMVSTVPGRFRATPVHLAQRPSATMSGSFLSRATRTLSPMATSTAGSRVRAAKATATTERIMPRAIERKTMTGTRNTAASDSTTVSAERKTALPAVDMAFSMALMASLPSARSSR